MKTARTILHVDMDAFFASIAQLDHPELRGKAVLTGGDGPRGVVTTASYEARPYGCRSAMPMAQAKRLCPHAIVVKVPGERIRECSRKVFAVLDEVSPLVQPVSVDEGYVDITGSLRLLGDAVAVGRRVKRRIRETTGLTASVGVSFNKFLAKLASDLEKPDGLTLITPGNLDSVLLPMPVERLHGVGPATAQKLHRLGLRTVGDLRQRPLDWLTRRLGAPFGEHLHHLAHGIDDRPVVPDREAKSIGHEQTFGVDLDDVDAVRAILLGQVEAVARRLRQHGLQARGIGLKIRFGDFQTLSRSATLDEPTDLTDDLWRAARTLYDRWAATSFQPVRLIGIHADRLAPRQSQAALFPDPRREKLQQLDATLDQITQRFGKGTIRRGPSLG